MPGDFEQIEILDVLAVNVNLKIVCQTGDPLDDAPLGAVAFVEKRRYHRHTRLLEASVPLLHRHPHDFAPASQYKDGPQARPADRRRIFEIPNPKFLDVVGIQDAGCGEAIRAKSLLDCGAQVFADPARKRERKSALGTRNQVGVQRVGHIVARGIE